MFRCHTVRIIAIVAVLLWLGGQSVVDAQSAKSTPTNVGNRAWIVVKFDSNRTLDPGYRYDAVLADFDGFEAAVEYAERLNDGRSAGLGGNRWFYLTRKRDRNEVLKAPSSEIQKPETKFVDVPPLKKKSSLAGKKGKGKFGKYALDAEFQADGKFVIRDPDADGSVLNSGTWSESEGIVSVTTDSYRYTGRLKDGTIEGKRYKRSDYTEESWSLALENASKSAKGNVPQIAGTRWKVPYMNDIVFKEDGTVIELLKTRDNWIGTWTTSGAEITITRGGITGKPDVVWFKGTLTEDALTGKHHAFEAKQVFTRVR